MFPRTAPGSHPTCRLLRRRDVAGAVGSSCGIQLFAPETLPSRSHSLHGLCNLSETSQSFKKPQWSTGLWPFLNISNNSDPFSVHGSLIRGMLLNYWEADGECRGLGCLAVRWLSPALADGEGCWLTPDESGSAQLFPAKARVFPA